MNVLVVDDDPAVRAALARALGRDGHEVVLSSSAAEAFAAGSSFAVAIVDIVVGHEDGVSIAAELLSRGAIGHVVFFTSGATGDAVGRAREIGRVVAKGQGLSELVRVVAAIPI